MNFLALQDSVGNNFGPNDDQLVKDSINQAIHEICGERLWHWTEQTSGTIATVVGQSDYILSGTTPIVPDCRAVRDVISVANGKKLWLAETSLFDEITAASTGNLTPAIYTVSGGASVASNPTSGFGGGNIRLRLWPPPVAVTGFILKYWRGSDSLELSGNTDVHQLIPARHHRAIVFKAIEIGLSMDDQVGQSQKFAQLYETAIAKMIAEDQAFYQNDSTILQPKMMFQVQPRIPIEGVMDPRRSAPEPALA